MTAYLTNANCTKQYPFLNPNPKPSKQQMTPSLVVSAQ
jgi:hypothetical protein